MSVTVACVLRSGGVYSPAWVTALAAGVHRYLPDARFVCLTDMAVPEVETIPLLHGWPGWWSKIELFRPGIFSGRVLYLDLDSIVVGDLRQVAAYAGSFAMLMSFYRAGRIGSGVMAWPAGFGAELYERFRRAPAPTIARYRRAGDQAYIRATSPVLPEIWQTMYPGQIVSFKVHCRRGVPPGARIVCFHGNPKPSIPGVLP